MANPPRPGEKKKRPEFGRYLQGLTPLQYEQVMQDLAARFKGDRSGNKPK